mgnify:CR=1 FL=1
MLLTANNSVPAVVNNACALSLYHHQQLMDMTEDMLRRMIFDITGSFVLTYHPNRNAETGPGDAITIDFEPPFERLPMIETIEKRGNFTLPRPLDGEECRQFLMAKCTELELGAEPPTCAKLIDKLTVSARRMVFIF